MKLNYFTYSFPSGNTISWKKNELEVFSNGFEKIEVVPFFYIDPVEPEVILPPNVSVHKNLLDKYKKPSFLRRLFKVIRDKNRVTFLREFIDKKVYRSLKHFADWTIDSYHIISLLNHPLIKKMGKESDDQTIWYFFWGRHPALLIPLLKTRYKAKIACRFHGYDLYEKQYGGYIPYRQHILNNTDLYLPCSENGKKYLEQNLNIATEKIFVARLGVKQEGISPFENDPTLRIVSCSDCVPIKRLQLIVGAIKHINIPVEWTHIGDGPTLKNIIQSSARIKNKTRRFYFPGYLSNKEVYSIYLTKGFDVFLNVSESEGVPVSVMEAMSAGLPIIATDVGGTKEIVDGSNGVLINKHISAQELAELLEQFKKIPPQQIEQLRSRSISKYKERSDAQKNAAMLMQKLKEYFG
jgi:colanic acid/amylovoran biosynthesis glycosyltransferase